MKKVYLLVAALSFSAFLAHSQAGQGGPELRMNGNDNSYPEGIGISPSVRLDNPDGDTTKAEVVADASSTAVEGVDYVLNNTMIVWPPNTDGNMSYSIVLLDNGQYDPVRTLNLRLRNPTNGASITDSMFNIQIWDDDSITTDAPCADLFFSEYAQSYADDSRYLEVFNPTQLPIDLSTYSIRIYASGSTIVQDSVPLSGTLLPKDVFLVSDTGSIPAIKQVADMLAPMEFFGFEAVGLYNGNTLIDLVGGIIGQAPFGNRFPLGGQGGTAASVTAVRDQFVFQGETDYHIGYDNWNTFNQGTYTDTGTHTMLPCGFSGPSIFIITGDAQLLEGGTFGWSIGISDENSDTTSVDVVVESSSTATPGADYIYTPMTIKFPPNSGSSQSVSTTLVADGIAENPESLTFKITNAQNPAGVLVGDSIMNWVIWDVDSLLADNVCRNLFISEAILDYALDSRALEFMNPTNASINLAGYEVRIYPEGATIPDSIIPLSGTVASKDVFVIARDGSDAAVIAQADQTSPSLSFSQHSTIELVDSSNQVLDVIGVKGGNTLSGSGWPPGLQTIVRNSNVQQGQPYPWGAAHWTGYPQSNYTFLGSHTMDTCIIPPPMIGVVDADVTAPEDTGTVEVSVSIANPSPAAITVDVVVDGSSTTDAGDGSISPTTLTFPGGSTTPQTITVTVTDDSDVESSETLTLRLTNASDPTVVFGDTMWSLTIIDNDVIGIAPVGELDFSLAPNPVRDQVTISVADAIDWDLIVTDLMGRVVLAKNAIASTQHTLATSSLATGVYVVHVDANGKEGVKKFVKE